MSEFVIESIGKAVSWINGLQAHLDAPVESSHALPRQSLSLRGWVACSSSKIVSIRLVWFETQLANAKLYSRPDAEAALEGAFDVVGFRIDVVPLVLGDREPLRVVADTADGRTSTVFEIALRFSATADRPTTVPSLRRFWRPRVRARRCCRACCISMPMY